MQAHATHSAAGTRQRIVAEPRWRSLERYTTRSLPPATRAWLTDDGSLTARLVALDQGPFRVQRLYQGWEVPLLTERALLGCPPRQRALVREVALRLGDEAVVFARSVFPVASLHGCLGHLRRLHNRSLGAILFSHPDMQRSPFELAPMRGDSAYLPPQLRQPTPAWGRRSRFDIQGKQLLVSEVFLQPFRPWPATLPVHRSQRGRVNAAFASPTQ